MAIEPGDVVVLKSGGQPMTVATVDENSVECLWLGEEGELFRETIPSVALSVVAADTTDEEEEDLDVEDDEDDEEDEEHEEVEHDDDEEDEEKSSKKKRRSA
jgi:uncharacterized protein YodC (DUF2158 family)